MDYKDDLYNIVKDFLARKYDLSDPTIEFIETKKDFEGDITIVLFNIIKLINDEDKESLGESIGNELVAKSNIVDEFNLVQGFLNLEIADTFYIDSLHFALTNESFFEIQSKDDIDTFMVEYSSPNTNKPLHLGHIRNNLLGYSISKILEANGKKVIKTQIINDRGIHICKSIVAWKLYGENSTPESTGIKGDEFVGNYYVLFEKKHKEEVEELISNGINKEEAVNQSNTMKLAKETLKNWENGDKEVRDIWKMMNDWVYVGFEETYNTLGVSFDKNYYESETYLLGKEIVNYGLENNVFYKKEDSSIWVDLTDDGLDEKLLLRSDGTSVYMTQDIGTAIKRFNDFPKITKQIYTVGSEQDYHFKVLFKILDKLNYKWANDCYHLSYGMIDLPDGKMKSREGKVVDADDLIENMIQTAKNRTNELGKNDDFEAKDLSMLYEKIALGALKYYLLKVDSRKKMLFNPDESIDFQGNTGPFIQYTYARIRSIIRRSELLKINYNNVNLNKIYDLSLSIKKLINHIYIFPDIISQSSKTYSPSLLCQYVFDLAKLYNSFYQDEKIFDGENNETTSFKISLSDLTANTIKNSLELLGVGVPNKM